MLIATTMMLLGLLSGIVATQLRGLRLGGVIVVPLSAVYLLRSFATFPILVMSVIAAYVSLHIVKSRLLLFGRRLFIVSVIVGAVVPVVVFELVATGLEPTGELTGVEFVVSILPGIAAYNFHQLSVEQRTLDAVWSLTTVLFLVVVGIGLVIAVGLSPLAGYLPPVLLGPKSDIAIAFGLEVARPTVPILASRAETLALVAGGLVVSEVIRSRYGLRVGGVIVVTIIVLAAFRNAWMLPLWAVVAFLSFVGIRLIHWWTLVYGRVLLSMSIILGLFTAISLAPMLPLNHGLLPFFVGILGGVTAYNTHVVPRAERLATVLVTLTVLSGTLAVARLVIEPAPSGLLREVTIGHAAAGILLAVPGLIVMYRLDSILPVRRLALTLGRERTLTPEPEPTDGGTDESS